MGGEGSKPDGFSKESDPDQAIEKFEREYKRWIRETQLDSIQDTTPGKENNEGEAAIVSPSAPPELEQAESAAQELAGKCKTVQLLESQNRTEREERQEMDVSSAQPEVSLSEFLDQLSANALSNNKKAQLDERPPPYKGPGSNYITYNLSLDYDSQLTISKCEKHLDSFVIREILDQYDGPISIRPIILSLIIMDIYSLINELKSVPGNSDKRESSHVGDWMQPISVRHSKLSPNCPRSFCFEKTFDIPFFKGKFTSHIRVRGQQTRVRGLEWAKMLKQMPQEVLRLSGIIVTDDLVIENQGVDYD